MLQMAAEAVNVEQGMMHAAMGLGGFPSCG